MGQHIITVESLGMFKKFKAQGYLGVSPRPPGDPKKPILRASAVGTNWDIIADLKRVKPGDTIFVHVKGHHVFGVYEASTHFMEDPQTMRPYRSPDLKKEVWEKYEKFPEPSYYWQVGIRPKNGNQFDKGFHPNEVFKLKAAGKIISIPER